MGDIAREMAGRSSHAALGAPVVAYGKGGIAGTAGEQEHVVALLTTSFGDALRQAVGGGKAWISSATKRGGPGTVIDIPLAHKDALYVRDNYDALEVRVPDAPASRRTGRSRRRRQPGPLIGPLRRPGG